MRLIDADLLKRVICQDQCEKPDGCDRSCETMGYINDAPTIDAVPVVRGHWMPYYRDILQCSSCKMTTSVPYMSGHYKYDYCPHCGAKMDEVSE